MEGKEEAGGLTPEESEFVPPAVKRQLEAAEAIVKGQNERAEDPGSPETNELPSEEVSDDEVQEALPESVPKREDWKHKYLVLKGKYDAEIPDLNSRLMVLGATIESQTGMIQDLQQKLNAALAAPPSEKVDRPKLDVIDESEFEGYGEHIVKLVRQVNAMVKAGNTPPEKVAAPTVDPGIEQRLQNIEQRVIKTAEQEYFEKLTADVPDWQSVNRDPKFLAWLQQPDPITEIIRMEAIKRGSRMFNARQVTSIFNAYKREAGIVSRPAPVKKDLKTQVSVVTNLAGGESDPEGEDRDRAKYATKEEFSKAKDLFIKGRLREVEFNKVSNRFQAAIRDKKVR
jgi:hypothetical protein